MSKNCRTSASSLASEANDAISAKAVLEPIIPSAKFPDKNTVVTGALDATWMPHLVEAGVEHIINLQPQEELTFDEQAEAEAHGIRYTHIPIHSEKDLKQLNLLAFDKALRQHHGRTTLIHCASGSYVGACAALRAGWLRGRKMDTAMQRGIDHGLQSQLEEEVRLRLLVPR